MAAVVADTHAIIWYFSASKKLSDLASTAFEEALADGHSVYISAITLVEVIYLVEKGKLLTSDLEAIVQAVSAPDPTVVVVPLDLQVAQAVAQIPRETVPELGDRIIAATALHLGVPLVTCDSRIRALTIVETIW
uniref:Ribonuclease VapC n=1 Tax=Cyanothece sp. (strain PCC 7425 / ATCC 29141) TaxID=395961 RepID=B8HZH0_CYAP4